MTRNTLTLCRLALFSWLSALSLLGLPLLFTGVPSKPLEAHVNVLEAMTMKAPGTTIAFDWTARFIYTRLGLATAVVSAAIAFEWRARRSLGDARAVATYYVAASSVLLAYLSFGLFAILIMLIVI